MDNLSNLLREMWDARYASPDWSYGTDPNGYFREKLSACPSGRLLLPAEGEGRNAAWAASQGWEVEAFDISPEGKRKAETLASKTGFPFHYQVAEADRVNYPEAHFDALGLIYAHFPKAGRATIYPRLCTYLKPGGLVILECFGERQLEYQPRYNSGGPRDVDLLPTAAELRSLFEGFDFLELLEGEVALNEGKYHQGQAWVCRLLGRKH